MAGFMGLLGGALLNLLRWGGMGVST
jgi:hypothetical protein